MPLLDFPSGFGQRRAAQSQQGNLRTRAQTYGQPYDARAARDVECVPPLSKSPRAYFISEEKKRAGAPDEGTDLPSVSVTAEDERDAVRFS